MLLAFTTLTGLLCLDLKDAFNAIWHDRLLTLLIEVYGVSKVELMFFYDYLHERKAKVEIDGVTSKAFPLNAGVGQGSALSPLLFVLAIAPIADFLGAELAAIGITLYIFADDLTLLMWADTWIRLGKNMCIAYKKSYEWCGSTGNIINEAKTDVLPLLTHRDVNDIRSNKIVLKEDIVTALTVTRIKDAPKQWDKEKPLKLMGLKIGPLLDGRHMIKGRVSAAKDNSRKLTMFLHTHSLKLIM